MPGSGASSATGCSFNVCAIAETLVEDALFGQRRCKPRPFFSLAAAAPDPDHLGRLPAHEAELVEVGIFRDDREPVRRGVLPDAIVVGPFEAQLPDVHGVRIELGKGRD